MKAIVLILYSVILLTSCESKSAREQRVISWQSAVEKNDYIALDVRTKKEVAANAAPGSMNIPLAELESKINNLDPSKNILVFCEAGVRASRVKSILIKKGFSSVINVRSWRDWNAFYKK